MERKLNVACVLLLLVSLSYAERNISVEIPVTGVTVYSNGIAFVRRNSTLELPEGDVSLFIKNFTSSAVFDSVTVKDDKGAVRGIVRYQITTKKNETKYLTFEELLNESIGNSVGVLTKNGWKNGTLKWFSSDRLGVLSGDKLTIIDFDDIEELEASVSNYTKNVEVNETEKGVQVDEVSTSGKHSISINYFVPNVNWYANYRYYITSEAETGEGALQAWAAVLNNAGEDWENIKLKVVVGYPHMLSYYVTRYATETLKNLATGYPAEAPSVVSEFVSAFLGEYYVYTLTDLITLKNGEMRNLPLFESSVKYKKEYIWDTTWERPHKVYKLNNSGAQSWASGTVRVYLGDEFLGEDSIKYTAKGKEAEVTVADVPEIVVKKLVNSTTGKEYTYARTTTYSVSLSIENRKDEKIELRVRDWMNPGDVVTLITSNPPAERKEQNKLEWVISLGKGESKTITYVYTVTNYYYY
jgi:hypothetical protein